MFGFFPFTLTCQKTGFIPAAILILVLILHPLVVLSQDTGTRPSVGLALSGGGSSGFAHIGVLKVMEEAGLRPDLITGVSMGSLIGAMYSLGYSADSLMKLSISANWDVILYNKIPENEIVFPEKKYINNSIITLPVSLERVKWPTALINSQQIDKILSFYLWPSAGINDFSKLPIPFRCLATNLETCQKVELKSGYLPDAIRASIAVPSFFEPFRIDSMLLIDGGLLRNYPVSEAKEMGADIVIGSYTGAFLHKEKDLRSALDILSQIGFFTSYYDYLKQKELADLTIVPPLKHKSSTDFSQADSMIMIGYRAALPYREYFRELADSLDKLGPQKPVASILGEKYYSFDKIEVNGNRMFPDKQILAVLNIKPGEPVDQYRLTKQIDLIYSRSWFDRIKYRFINRNDSLILVLDCVEKPRSTIYGSAHYDLDLKFGILAGMTVRNLLVKRSVLDIDSYIGQYYRFRIAYLQFIDRQQLYSLSANLYADNTQIPFLEIENKAGRYLSKRLSETLSLSRRFGLNHLLSVSGTYDNLNLLPSFSYNSEIKRLQLNYLSAALEYNINTLDNKHFPNKGLEMNLSARISKLQNGYLKTDTTRLDYHEDPLNGSKFRPFNTLNGSFRQFISTASGKTTFSISGNFLYISNSDSISEKNNFFLLGGTYSLNRISIPMTGFTGNEFPVRKMAGLGTGLDIELLKNIHLSTDIDISAVQVGKDRELTLFTGFGIGAGYMTIAGPVKACVMYGYNKQVDRLNGIKFCLCVGFNF
jgi:NTE family protein